ncbi:hypothetical protein ACO0LF_31390 [Undibacterium sp. Di27W]
MTTNNNTLTDATNAQPQNSGSTGNSAPDRFDASERDIAEGDDAQTAANENLLENDGLNDADSESTSNSENNPENLDNQNDR